MKKYPKWEKAEKLACRNLRAIDVYIKKEADYRTDWITKEIDPCPTCDTMNPCHNKGKSFDEPHRLVIEKGE
jgi:hypothetical protein